MSTDEKPYGIILWAALILFIFLFVLVSDLWLYRHGHEMMTTEFKEGIKNRVWGPVLTGLFFGAQIGLAFHFYYSGRQ